MKNTLHDIIAYELLEKKSLSALIYLIDRGREVEFELNKKTYFISCSGSNKYVSLWNNQIQQILDSISDLMEYSTIENQSFISLWNKVEIISIFQYIRQFYRKLNCWCYPISKHLKEEESICTVDQKEVINKIKLSSLECPYEYIKEV